MEHIALLNFKFSVQRHVYCKATEGVDYQMLVMYTTLPVINVIVELQV